MNWRAIFVLLAVAAPCRVLADTASAPVPAAGLLCRRAIAAAERAHGIPAHLLAAIARVESGRRDDASGTFNPWPWTINMDGQGSFYEIQGAAVAAAVSMRPRVTISIDVGCMQISLTHHPDAFASMQQAFDPTSNADYGARFLVQLYQRTHSWPAAVALYHSATPEIGEEYQRLVYAAWPTEQRIAETGRDLPVAGGWAAGVNRSLLTMPLRQSGPHIIPLASGLMGGAAPPGRTLASYRLNPVRMVSRLR